MRGTQMATVQLDRLNDTVAALVLDAMHTHVDAVILCRDQTSARIEQDRVGHSIPEGNIHRYLRSNGKLEIKFADTGSTIRFASVRSPEYLRGRSLDHIIVMDDAVMDEHTERDAHYATLVRSGRITRL